MSTVESYLQGTPCWADLATSDVDAAREFYAALFGWEYTAYPMGPEQGDIVYYMSTLRGGNVAGLAQLMPGIDSSTRWNTYLAVDDTDAAVERAVAAGGTVLMPPDEIPGSGRLSTLLDPDGTQVSTWQTKGHIGSAVVNEPGAVSWNELHVDDVSAVIPFYTSVFGVEAKSMSMGDMGEYTQFEVDGRGIAGAYSESSESPHSWLIYFAVEDTDAAVAKAVALGGSVVTPPVAMPGMGTYATLRDPQGAQFAVFAG